ncbi:formylglycine-generating enzyme family protein [Myxococcota bacterium]|nr:formylglycine-generating enzyme family protein [Myxococcota bacterium]
MAVMAMLGFGCDDGGSKKTEAGTHGGPCLEGDLCNEGLECALEKCWLTEELGVLGNPCRLDQTCDGELVCDAGGICREAGEVGTLGNPCRTDDTCDALLVCDADVCRTDADEDGIPVERDCDDTDETVVPDVVVECQSLCNLGVKVCNANGSWSACTADENCDCETPGDMREVSCGNCGWAYQRCGTDFIWELPMECQDQGECREGSEATEECGFCGTRTRMCGPECTWFEWSECTGQGECEAGLTGTWTTEGCVDEGFVRQATCNDSCQWEELQPCTGDCLITPRAGGVDGDGNPDFKDEVCIPAGPFLMGDDNGAQYAYPQHRVIMTPYLIDVYEVTVGRYRECVMAGVCTVPSDPAQTQYFESDKENYPISGLTRAQAIEFCTWDDGRNLPTEAQWEKAARGPEPRANIYPWGSDYPTCDVVNMYDDECLDQLAASVDSYPDGTSYFGLYQMAGNVSEMTLDNCTAYENIGNNVDPYFSDGNVSTFSLRGSCYGSPLGGQNLAHRSCAAINPSQIFGMRCARRAY